MKTIEDLIDEYGSGCWSDGWGKSFHSSDVPTLKLENELKRRVRDLELVSFACTQGYSVTMERNPVELHWFWYNDVDTDVYVPATQPLIPELNDELRERLEKEFANAKANEG